MLEETEAAAFLLARTESERRNTPSDPKEAVALARKLGGLALALEQAGAYVAKNGLSFIAYRQRWESRKAEVLAWHDPRLMNYPSSVAVTWQTTVDQLHAPESVLLSVLAWLAPEPLPLSVLEGWSVKGTKACDALAELVSWSLARWTVDKDAFTIHRLVREITRVSIGEEQNAPSLMARLFQAVIRQRQRKQKKTAVLKEALARIEKGLPNPEWDETGWRLWEQMAPHVRALLDHVEDSRIELRAARIMNRYGVWLSNRAEYSQAELLYKRALRIWEKALGPQHPNVAASLNNLAWLYNTQGRYAKAEPLYERALRIWEKALGPEHPDVATSLNNLAWLYKTQGRYAKAEPLYARALRIWEKALGLEHPNTASSLDNLAVLYHDKGQYAKAEPLYERALRIREQALIPDHPDVAHSLNNLARIYHTQGQHEKAESLYQRALAIYEQALGPDHPHVAQSLNNQAVLYRHQGQYTKAEPLYQRALRERHEISVSSYATIRTNCIVPFSVERVRTNIYFCDLLF